MIQGTLADLISVTRFILAPVVAILLCMKQSTTIMIAIALFVFACFTDYLDGRVARLFGVTRLGAVLDHTADKFLIVLVLLTLSFMGLLKPFDSIPTVIMVGRDILLSGIRELSAKFSLELGTDYWGKVKTVCQMSGIIFILFSFFIPRFYMVGAGFLWLAALLSLFSCFNYMVQFGRLLLSER
jgi:CDP-diacylglycerol--glycerol-3-phosphate 3-phosphatidyltransferase